MTQSNPCVIAIDAGTTGVRSRVVSDHGPTLSAYREFTQHFPEPGGQRRPRVALSICQVAVMCRPLATIRNCMH